MTLHSVVMLYVQTKDRYRYQVLAVSLDFIYIETYIVIECESTTCICYKVSNYSATRKILGRNYVSWIKNIFYL